MTDSSKALSIIAYYLSEFDMEAVTFLGYKNRSEAIREISNVYDRNNNYLKLRRDEFDALPFSSSHRNGWKNRKPAKDVLELGKWLHNFSFEELSSIVASMLENQHSFRSNSLPDIIGNIQILRAENTVDENEIEQIINAADENASIEVVLGNKTKRVLDTSIISNLKRLYQGNCQICGCKPLAIEGVDICEAHHIEYFSKSQNNNASNIIILCPNHHRLIHKCNPSFDPDRLMFTFEDGHTEELKLNYHL